MARPASSDQVSVGTIVRRIANSLHRTRPRVRLDLAPIVPCGITVGIGREGAAGGGETLQACRAVRCGPGEERRRKSSRAARRGSRLDASQFGQGPLYAGRDVCGPFPSSVLPLPPRLPLLLLLHYTLSLQSFSLNEQYDHQSVYNVRYKEGKGKQALDDQSLFSSPVTSFSIRTKASRRENPRSTSGTHTVRPLSSTTRTTAHQSRDLLSVEQGQYREDRRAGKRRRHLGRSSKLEGVKGSEAGGTQRTDQERGKRVEDGSKGRGERAWMNKARET